MANDVRRIAQPKTEAANKASATDGASPKKPTRAQQFSQDLVGELRAARKKPFGNLVNPDKLRVQVGGTSKTLAEAMTAGDKIDETALRAGGLNDWSSKLLARHLGDAQSGAWDRVSDLAGPGAKAPGAPDPSKVAADIVDLAKSWQTWPARAVGMVSDYGVRPDGVTLRLGTGTKTLGQAILNGDPVEPEELVAAGLSRDQSHDIAHLILTRGSHIPDLGGGE